MDKVIEPLKLKRTPISKWFESQGYEAIAPMDFYRFMYPEGELVEWSKDPRSAEVNQEWKYNAILNVNTHEIKTKYIVDPKDKDKPVEEQRKHKTEKERWRNYIITDDLQTIQKAVDECGNNEYEYFIAPNSYLGRYRSKERERWVYACIFDIDHPKVKNIDGHRRQIGLEQLIHDWTKSSIPYLMPSAVVSSGSGVHLVYFLDRPYQIQDEYQKMQWDNFRYRFTKRAWSKDVTDSAMQYQNHCQIFRVVGTRTKKGALVEAFWMSKKRYSIDELFGMFKFDELPKWDTMEELIAKMDEYNNGLFEPDELMKTTKEPMPKTELQESERMRKAREQWPEWHEDRIVKKNPKKQPGQWTTPKWVYDWYLREARENAQEGCRYNRILALAQYAIKCRVEYEEFKDDALELYHIYKDVKANDPFRWIEFVKARDEYFNKISHRSTRKWIESHTLVPMKPSAPRNHRKQMEHLQADKVRNDKGIPIRNKCKDNRESTLEYMRENGLIPGRPTKCQIVQEWRRSHPEGRKTDCIKDTGLSKPTVLKWWDCTE